MKTNLKIAFDIPKTARVIVKYQSKGVTYAANIERPANTEALRAVMLSRKVGLSQIKSVEAHVPHVPKGLTPSSANWENTVESFLCRD